MAIRLYYEVAFGQTMPGQADRLVRIDMEADGTTPEETREALSAFLTAASGERETIHRTVMAVHAAEENEI